MSRNHFEESLRRQRLARLQLPRRAPRAASSPSGLALEGPRGPCPSRSALRIPVAFAVLAQAAALRRFRKRSTAPAPPRPAAAAESVCPSRFISSVTGSSCGAKPSNFFSVCASLAVSTASSCCPCCRVAPSRSRATTFQRGSFRYFGSGCQRYPKIHRRVDVVIRFLRCSRRWQESHSRLHHSDHGWRHVPPADAHRLSDNLLVAAKRPLPNSYPSRIDFTGPCREIRILETAPCGRLQPHHAKIVLGHLHSLHGLAAVIANQKIESPVIRGDSLETISPLSATRSTVAPPSPAGCPSSVHRCAPAESAPVAPASGTEAV